MKTFLKSSDRWKDIISKFPIRFNDYYEPFLKSGEVFFNLFNEGRIFNKAFISSADKNLIQAYQAVRDEPERLQKIILHYCEHNSKHFFDNIREAVGTPSAYIYVNRATDSNGKWRQSQFIDRNRDISKDTESIERCSRYMNRWCGWCLHSHWEHALTNVSAGDLVWLEPPPIKYTADARIDFFAGQFNESNHVYLKNYIEQLVKKNVHVFMIQSPTPATERVYGSPTCLLDKQYFYKW